MECNPRYIRIAELARLAGVTVYYARKWTRENLIPHSRRPGERVLYPSDEALEAIRQVLEPRGGLDRASVEPVVIGAGEGISIAVQAPG